MNSRSPYKYQPGTGPTTRETKRGRRHLRLQRVGFATEVALGPDNTVGGFWLDSEDLADALLSTASSSWRTLEQTGELTFEVAASSTPPILTGGMPELIVHPA